MSKYKTVMVPPNTHDKIVWLKNILNDKHKHEVRIWDTVDMVITDRLNRELRKIAKHEDAKKARKKKGKK